PEVANRLLRVASRVDDDPLRNKVRQTFLKRDQQALRDLAASEKIAEQPAVTLTLISHALTWSSDNKDIAAAKKNLEAAAALLRQGQRHHPSDFWINQYLASVIVRLEPPQLDDAIRFYTAAVALRPGSPGAHVNLGLALKDKGDVEGAIQAYQ